MSAPSSDTPVDYAFHDGDIAFVDLGSGFGHDVLQQQITSVPGKPFAAPAAISIQKPGNVPTSTERSLMMATKDSTKMMSAPERKKANSSKNENSQLFADLLQARMLEQEKATLRDVDSQPDHVVYEFSNGDKVTADRSKIEGANSADALQKLITDCIDKRTRP
jgi:hypothetical protein